MSKSTLKTRGPGVSELKKIFEQAGGAVVKVGVLEGAGAYSGGPTIAEVAAWNEFGTDQIPSRPFFRTAMVDGQKAIAEALEVAAKSIVDGAPVEQALGRVGLLGQSLVRQSIDNTTKPPNAPSTIKAKGSTHPLINGGTLRRVINFQVVKKGEGG